MRKIFVTILLIAVFAFTANAQTKNMAVGADFVISIPLGDLEYSCKIRFWRFRQF